MPLLKLWNSLIGRTPNSTASVATTVTPATGATNAGATNTAAPVAPVTHQTAASGPTRTAKSQPAKATKAASPAVRLAPLTTPEPAPLPVPVAKRQAKVVTRGEHAELCKVVIQTQAATVLEIGAGDGSRAIAMMDSLQAVSADKTLRYCVIDQFEMVNGPISLKAFNLALRAINVRAQVFPNEVEQGLSQFSRTVGFADLIVSTVPTAQWQTAAVQALVKRISHAGSVVLHSDGSRWQRSGKTVEQTKDHRVPTRKAA